MIILQIELKTWGAYFFIVYGCFWPGERLLRGISNYNRISDIVMFESYDWLLYEFLENWFDLNNINY